MPFYTLFDPRYWLLVGPALLLGVYASIRVKSAFNHYARVGVRSGLTGAQAAERIARAGGAEVQIERVQGFLSDHYDPRSRTLRLSPQVYEGRSVSAIAVAAHEVGHALQHAHGYGLLQLRSSLVPVTQIGSSMWMYVFLGGMLMRFESLMLAGLVMLALTVVFQLVTLPVEFDASRRAKQLLASSGIVSSQEEAVGVQKVLSAAALTYVAGLLTAIGTLLYYLSLFLGSRSRD